MKQQVKDDWIINNRNIFGLQQDINMLLFCIQIEILKQLEGKKIGSISEYLGIAIDIRKEIHLTRHLTIEKALSDYLGFEDINPLNNSTFNCFLILNYLQFSLLKEYHTERNKNILTFSEYEKQYSTLLNNFLFSNIDTDEQDFIKAEQTLCDNLITELNKPVYNNLNGLNEVTDEPCSFKKKLINSIDKRKKFLEKKANEKPPQPGAKQNDKLSDLITHQKSIEIIDAIKTQYKNIKGKRLKLLLLALQELNLLPNERIAQKFYDCCNREFGWDVASYTAMNDYKFNVSTDKIELDNMKKFLEEIIQTK